MTVTISMTMKMVIAMTMIMAMMIPYGKYQNLKMSKYPNSTFFDRLRSKYASIDILSYFLIRE